MCMRMIDAHTHLHDVRYDDDRDMVMARMRAIGVTHAITIGTSVQTSRAAVACARRYEGVFATVGLHPHIFNGDPGAGDEWQADLGAQESDAVRLRALDAAIAQLRTLAQENVNVVVGVGECGLDYFAHNGGVISARQRTWQRAGFVAQIVLARELGVPVIVHGRGSTRTAMDAYEDIHDVIMQYPQVRFVLHCYMGNRTMTEQFLALNNVVFSFAGNVTYVKKGIGPLDNVLRMIPSSRIMIETDAPYLAPFPHRGKRNESAYITHTAAYIASIYEISVQELAMITYTNTRLFFSL